MKVYCGLQYKREKLLSATVQGTLQGTLPRLIANALMKVNENAFLV